MSVGLLAVVDDILAAALKASAKSAGVVIDDAAVTPQYVQGITPARELPVVGKIALGSLANKFLLIIPAAMALTAFAPWALPFLLIIGGMYLCFEGAEKVLEWFGFGHGHDDEGARDEKRLVRGAIRTDLILSTEIMLIGLADIDPDMGFWSRLAVLAVIALSMTVLVYGVVALLVKLDDVGLKMTASRSTQVQRVGQRLVQAMPTVFRVISVVGTVAMLWVGGHLVVANVAEVGFTPLYDFVHVIEHAVEPLGVVAVWLVGTAASAVIGFVLGLVIIVIVMGVAQLFGKKASFDEGAEEPSSVH